MDQKLILAVSVLAMAISLLVLIQVHSASRISLGDGPDRMPTYGSVGMADGGYLCEEEADR